MAYLRSSGLNKIKYPSGHVIQTTSVTIGTNETAVSSGTWASTVVSASVTPKYASSSIILHADFGIYVNNTSGDAGYVLRTKKVHAGGTSYPITMADEESGANIATGYLNIDPGDQQESYYVTYQDPTAGVITAITYTLDCYFHNPDGGGSHSMGGPNSREWRIWFREIQR